MSTTYGLHRALLLNRNGVAVRFEDRKLSFAELADRVARFAGALVGMGVGPGDRVAVLSLNQPRYLEMFLAAAWVRAVIVPLNIRWSVAENTDAAGDCRPKVLVVDATFAAAGRAIAAAIGGLTLVYADDARVAESDGMADYDRLVAATPPVADAEARGDELAGVFYTGGTTGRSKGVMLSHRNLMSNALNMLAEGLSNADAVYLHAAPMFHLANAAAMYFHFLGGGSHVVLRTFTPAGLAEAIERRRVTDTLLV